MRNVAAGILLTIGLGSAGPSFAADTESITIVEGVAVLEDRLSEAIFYYENNWGYFRRAAMARGYIESFEIVVGDDRAEDVDIVLITRFESAAQYEAIESRFQEIMGERELELLNDLQPGEFRENVFVVTSTGDASDP